MKNCQQLVSLSNTVTDAVTVKFGLAKWTKVKQSFVFLCELFIETRSTDYFRLRKTAVSPVNEAPDISYSAEEKHRCDRNPPILTYRICRLTKSQIKVLSK